MAVSAPIWRQGTQAGTEGRVYVYSGNTALGDPIVANADPVETEPPWVMSVYPNPASNGEDITIELSDSFAKTINPISLELYNLKGQRVMKWAIDANPDSIRSFAISTQDLASGIYILRAWSNQRLQYSIKICIVK